MKLLTSILSTILCGSLFASGVVNVPVSGEFNAPEQTAQIAAVIATSDTANGTIVVSAIKQTPIYTNAIDVINTYRTDYTVVYTNGSSTITNTTSYNPMPLGPNVISFTTNKTIIASVTNAYKAVKKVITVTNELYSGTCSGSALRANINDGAWILPGERLLSSGTADGAIQLIIKTNW